MADYETIEIGAPTVEEFTLDSLETILVEFGGGDPTPPVVDSFSPVSGQIIPAQIISFEVSDSSPLNEDEGGIVIFVNYTDYGVQEVAYNGDSFIGEYSGSVVSGGENILDFTVQRSNGWFASPMQIVVQASDTDGNTTIETVDYTVDPNPTPPDPDSIVPVVNNFSPSPGETLQPSDTVQFDVTDNSGSFTRILVVAWFKSTGDQEVVHDGDSFIGHYTASSSRVIISGGYRYYVSRSGGWELAPTIRVFPIDAQGNEA
jgi:hypothetical protein